MPKVEGSTNFDALIEQYIADGKLTREEGQRAFQSVADLEPSQRNMGQIVQALEQALFSDGQARLEHDDSAQRAIINDLISRIDSNFGLPMPGKEDIRKPDGSVDYLQLFVMRNAASEIKEDLHVELVEHPVEPIPFFRKLLDALIEVFSLSFAKTRTFDHTADYDRWRQVGVETARHGGQELKTHAAELDDQRLRQCFFDSLQQANPEIHHDRLENIGDALFAGFQAEIDNIQPAPPSPDPGDDDLPPVANTYNYDIGPVQPDTFEEQFDRVWGDDDGIFSEYEAAMHWAALSMNTVFDAGVRIHDRDCSQDNIGAGDPGSLYLGVVPETLDEYLDSLAENGARPSLEAKMGILLESAGWAYLKKVYGQEPERSRVLDLVARVMAQRHVPIWDFISVNRARGHDEAASECRQLQTRFIAECERFGWEPPEQPNL